jgi:hypothetical protein
MALGAFQASLNILIHYERLHSGFYVPYFHIQLLGKNTEETHKLELTSACILDIYEYFTTTSM